MPAEQYPADWDDRRRQVYQRDDYECQNCGAQGGHAGNTELHAHHQTPISQGGSHDLQNLVTLCRSCHNNQHDHDITGGDYGDTSTTTTAGPLESLVYTLVGGLLLPFVYLLAGAAIFSVGESFGEIGMALSLIAAFGVGIVLGLSFVRVTIVGYASYGAIAAYQVLVGEQTIAGLFEFFVPSTTEQFVPTALATGLILLYMMTPLLTAVVVSVSSKNWEMDN